MDAVARTFYGTEIDRFRSAVRRLRRLLREAEAEIARLEPLVDLDPLVPLFNRRAFMREMGRVGAYCKRYGGTAVFVHVGLDGFESVNARFGYAAGDAVLKHISRLLLQNTRKSDIVGRLGGDEFGVLLVRTAAAAGWSTAERIKAQIGASRIEFADHDIAISASTGLALVDGKDDDDSVILLANEAMYRSRQAIMSGSS